MARDRFERLDRKLGVLVARLAGSLMAIAAIGAGAALVRLDDFSLATYWPVLAIAALLLLGAWACFRARPSFLDMMSETPLNQSEAAARRRNLPVDDDGRR